MLVGKKTSLVRAASRRYRSHAIGWFRHLQIIRKFRLELVAAAEKLGQRYLAAQTSKGKQELKGDHEALAVDNRGRRVEHRLGVIQLRLFVELKRGLGQPLPIEHQPNLPRKHQTLRQVIRHNRLICTL